MPDFSLSAKEIQKLVKFNYPFITIVGIFIFLLSYIYHIVPIGIVLFTILMNLFATFLVHILALKKASPKIQGLGFSFLSLTIILTISYGITFFNAETRPAAILIFIPTLILQASISLFFGILAIILTTFSLILMYYLKINDFSFSGHAINFIFNYFFLLVLGFLANYSSEILRRKEAEIKKIAKINENLYQMSKTTSDEIVKNMTEALVVLDDNLKIARYNSAFSLLFREKNDLTNESFLKFSKIINADIKALAEEIKKSDSRQTLSINSKDDQKNEYEISLSTLPLKENKKGFLLLIDKKLNPWGKVFESGSKKPVSLAIIRLIRASDNRIMETKATDENGNFGFMVTNGDYKLTVSKDGFVFPSASDKTGYHGEIFQPSSNLVNLNIALDSTSPKQAE